MDPAPGNFPTTPNAFDASFNGGYWDGDAFVAKLSASGSELAYATFLGGGSHDSKRASQLTRPIGLTSPATRVFGLPHYARRIRWGLERLHGRLHRQARHGWNATHAHANADANPNPHRNANTHPNARRRGVGVRVGVAVGVGVCVGVGVGVGGVPPMASLAIKTSV